MTIKRFVEAAGRTTGFEPRGLERIPGTNKVRTYCANALQYSRESDLEKIVSKQYRAAGVKKKI